MQVLMAEHHGMCFGVRDAIELATNLTADGPVTILGDLVHNPDVVAQLDSAGARRARHLDEIQTQAVLLTAHGTSDRVKLQLRQAGREVHDATCPLVTRAHLALRKLVGEGYFPVVIGQRDHVEVRGLVGDLDDFMVLLDEAEIGELTERFGQGQGARLGVVAQTTQPIERVRDLVEAIRAQLPAAEARFIDTVCQPTKDRQDALRRLIAETEVIVVVGGPDSNNSRKLAELARKEGRRAYQVSDAADLRPEWFEGVECVGLTAGTSTPDAIIEEVRAWLEKCPGFRGLHPGLHSGRP
jgi:4-hydroxy-3-methylbut-2-enyl diphosphate reductase